MNDEKVKRGRGCFFYGCLTLVVLFVVALLGTFFGVRYAFNKALDKYTDSSPMALPKVEMPAEQAGALLDRLKAFKAAVETDAAAEPLALTEQELNALIASAPDLAGLKDKVYVAITGDQIKGQVSLPLDQLPIGRTAGRYLNGSATFNVSMDGGVLIVTLQKLDVKGESVPARFLTALQRKNLAQSAYDDVQKAEFLRRIESVEVKDGTLFIKPRTAR
jgi:hypothetical protein